MDVVVEELWIKLVATIPINNPANGLSVIVIIVRAKSPPNNLKECPSNLIPRRNKYMVMMTTNILKIVSRVEVLTVLPAAKY
jgi:hypothetical protein